MTPADDREDAVHVASLHAAIATMDLPSARKTARSSSDLAWIGRNMAIRNADHPRFDDAVLALHALGVSFILD